MKGMRRIKGSAVTPKAPVTPELLLRLHSTLVNSPEDTLFWAAALIMFFGLLRKSNVFCPPARSQFDPQKHFCRGNVSLPPEAMGQYVSITCPWAKNNQFQERVHTVTLPHLPGHPLNPALALHRALAVCPGQTSDAPALLRPSGVPYTYPSFLHHFKDKLKRALLNPEEFAAHSFRRGGATWAFRCGVPGEVIKQLGDWQSTCYLQYIEVSDASKVHAMSLFSYSLPSM